ncbi:MAG: protoporphyrinogen oxidase [Deltaproteobacteria bacterium]|nr:protoporphyrinogen oxidase [Deltaproteobacteria bacterium]
MNAKRTPRVVVIGAGLSGLVTAWKLLQRVPRGSVDLTVCEGSSRPGGNVSTERVGGYVLDGGPDSWVSAKPDATELCRALGLGDRLVETLPGNRRAFLLHRGKLEPLPEGLLMGVPTSPVAMARTPLVSWPGKLRMGLDLVLPRRHPSKPDESLGALVARRLGREAAEALAEPILAGVYAGDAWALSSRATFPQLVAMEDADRSLILSALRQRRRAPKRATPPSIFTSLEGGVGTLVEALLRALPEGTVRTGLRVSGVARLSDEDPRGRWAVEVDGNPTFFADHVALAAPMHRAARVLKGMSALSEALGKVPFGSAATVFFALDRRQVPHPLDGTGFLIPRREGLGLLASTWASSKWPGRAPPGKVLLRGFLGGAGRAEVVEQSDEALTTAARRELWRLLQIRGEPELTRVFRFRQATAQPLPGHREQVKAIHDAAADAEGLHLLGAAYDGVGIPDVVRLALKTADRIADALPLKVPSVSPSSGPPAPR